MVKRRPPLPRSFVFPGGFRVRVLHVRTGEHGLGKENNGEWILGTDGGKVLLRYSLPRDKKLRTLIHELDHAFTDWKNWFEHHFE